MLLNHSTLSFQQQEIMILLINLQYTDTIDIQETVGI